MGIKKILKIALIVGLILLIPLLGKWPWTLSDFVIMGGLLFIVVLVYEFAIKKIENKSRRTLVAVALLGVFLLVWAELAVGLFGTPFAGS